MFDYYAMPTNTPMIDCNEFDLCKRMGIIEDAVNKDIGENNCFFNFVLHEFEGLLFSSPKSFKSFEIIDPAIVEKIQGIRNKSQTPEHINNSPHTAPSKRLEDLIPNYEKGKVRNGTNLAKDMGIDVIKAECKHFTSWIEKIKNIN